MRAPNEENEAVPQSVPGCMIAPIPGRGPSYVSDPTAASEPFKERVCYLTGVQRYRLELACLPINQAFNTKCYLVGSVIQRPNFRDVDVRIMLDDDRFNQLFYNYTEDMTSVVIQEGVALWSVVCSAIGDQLSAATGLLVDFQIQRKRIANEKYNGGRTPLGIGSIELCGGGDATS